MSVHLVKAGKLWSIELFCDGNVFGLFGHKEIEGYLKMVLEVDPYFLWNEDYYRLGFLVNSRILVYSLLITYSLVSCQKIKQNLLIIIVVRGVRRLEAQRSPGA